MQIEIEGTVAAAIETAVASGQFSSAEDFIMEMVLRWRSEQKAFSSRMPKNIDINELKASQNAGTIRDYRDLAAEFWPEEDNIEDFLAFIRNTRKEPMPELRN